MTVTESPREHYRRMWEADRAANVNYAKSRFVLRWFRRCQRWRATPGAPARVMFIISTASYRFVTEWLMGIELPTSTVVGPGLRLRHGTGLVVNPASTIGANVLIRQGVTLGNRRELVDCPMIEDGVEIGVGAVIIGDIVVGRGARIAPNAVVVNDVPPRAIVFSPRPTMKLSEDNHN